VNIRISVVLTVAAADGNDDDDSQGPSVEHEAVDLILLFVRMHQ
jgi:hypothetical protein